MATRRMHSSQSLRAEISARHLADGSRNAEQVFSGEEQHRASTAELTFGRVASVLYAPDEDGGHGNFLRPAFRRILADKQWSARLQKAYTGAARLPRKHDRRRGELECAGSSDALLMNVFCYPGVLRRVALCARLGICAGLRPEFGVRAALPMRKSEVDRTELDMRLGELLVEAKLTETGFGHASQERVLRYLGVEEIFHLAELPTSGRRILGYQLVRGVLAAFAGSARYAVLLDARRADLQEVCFRVLSAVRSAEARSRFHLYTWQELSRDLPGTLQVFLAERFGIEPQ